MADTLFSSALSLLRGVAFALLLLGGWGLLPFIPPFGGLLVCWAGAQVVPLFAFPISDPPSLLLLVSRLLLGLASEGIGALSLFV
mgnify:CR=1 FL=1